MNTRIAAHALLIAALIATAAHGRSLGAQHVRPAAAARIAQVEWLAGGWIGTSGPATFDERWSPPSGGAMLAVSRTVKGNAMVAFEFLRIVERDGHLV
jgi:hypothetical protein